MSCCRLDPQIKSLLKSDPKVPRDIARGLTEEKLAICSEFPGAAGALADIIADIVGAIIADADLEPEQARHSNEKEPLGLELIELCYATESRACIPELLKRLLLPKPTSDPAKQIKEVVVPLVLKLRDYLVTKRLDFTSEPYMSFAKLTVTHFVASVMGPKPVEMLTTAALRSVGCGCATCQPLRDFFSSERTTLSLIEAPRKCDHLQSNLEKTRAWGVKWNATRPGSSGYYVLNVRSHCSIHNNHHFSD